MGDGDAQPCRWRYYLRARSRLFGIANFVCWIPLAGFDFMPAEWKFGLDH